MPAFENERRTLLLKGELVNEPDPGVLVGPVVLRDAASPGGARSRARLSTKAGADERTGALPAEPDVK